MPRIISIRAIAILYATTTAPTTGGILTHTSYLLVGGLLRLGLMLQLGLYVRGDGLLTGGANHIM
jgi:hypothetical protein